MLHTMPDLRTLLFLFFLGVGQNAVAQATGPPPSAQTFFERPAFSAALLSPNAKSLAVRIAGASGRDALAVIDLLESKAQMVAHFNDADIGNIQWVNNERLVFDLVDQQVGRGDVRFGPGLYAVNRDGTGFLQLVSRTNHMPRTFPARELLPWNTFLLPNAGPQDSDSVYVTNPKFIGPGDVEFVNLQRLDTLTGRVQSVNRPAGARWWLLDQTGAPRIVTAVERNMGIIYHRDPATDEWRKLAQHEIFVGSPGSFSPLFFGPDGSFYVRARKGRDKSAVYTYDLANNTMSAEPLIVLADYDFDGDFVWDRKKTLGFHFLTDAQATLWFDEPMKALHH